MTDNQLQVGFHCTIVKPPMGMRIPGTYTPRYADGFLSDLHLRAAAFVCGEQKAVIFSVESIGTANNWNVVQYAALTHMMAQVSGLEVGEFVHVIADCHIYDRHIPAVKAMLEKEGFEAPTFKMDKSIDNFYDFTKNSFSMENYRFHEFDFEIPMAI